MGGLRLLLRFALLSAWLPLRGGKESLLVHASFAGSQEDSVHEEVVVFEVEDEKQQQETPALSPVPVTLTPLPPRPNEDALDMEVAVLVSDENKNKPISGSPAKKTPFKAPFLAVVFGLALLAGALALERIIRPRGVPPALALELENALALLPDAEGLAKAVGTDEAKEAHICAERFILEAEKASKEAAVKVGAAREKALVHAQSNLAEAVNALKELHAETKRVALRDAENFPQFVPVGSWYEAMKGMAGENEYLKAVYMVTSSHESAASLASERSRLACELLESATFTSMGDGYILRQGARDFLAVQAASEEVLRFLGWTEETQQITLKTLADDQEIRRKATGMFLKEKIDVAFEACEKIMEAMKVSSSQGVNTTALKKREMGNKGLKQKSISLLAAHNEVIASLTRAETPEEHGNMIMKAKTLESSLNEIGNRLWQQAGLLAQLLQNADITASLEIQKLLLECALIEMKADTYKELAEKMFNNLQESLQKTFPGDAEGPLSRFVSESLVRKLAEDSQLISHHIDTHQKELKGLLLSVKQWAEIEDETADMSVVLEELEKGVGRLERELRDFVKHCQENLHLHMEGKFLISLEEYMDASTQTVERLSGLIEGELTEATQVMQQHREKYEKAKDTARKGTNLLSVAQAAALMGMGAAKLQTFFFKNERGLL